MWQLYLWAAGSVLLYGLLEQIAEPSRLLQVRESMRCTRRVASQNVRAVLARSKEGTPQDREAREGDVSQEVQEVWRELRLGRYATQGV